MIPEPSENPITYRENYYVQLSLISVFVLSSPLLFHRGGICQFEGPVNGVGIGIAIQAQLLSYT